MGAAQAGDLPDSTFRLRTSDIRIERLSDLTLVYHNLSGETHFLSPESAAIVGAMQAGRLSPRGLLDRLRTDFDISADGDDEALTSLAGLCEDLEQIGILERV